MCKGNQDCHCCQVHTLTANLLASESRVVSYLGRKTIIVPLIMAKSDVVMNGALVPEAEMMPEHWNGRPVTVGHPKADGNMLSATATPEIHSEWSIGTLFNTTLTDGVLRSEAWIDIARANKLFPGLIARLKSNETIDVSTGYFAQHEEAQGELNGRKYEVIHRNLRPDHLAILPDEVGACSWADGCGVRTNGRLMTMKSTFQANVAKALETMTSALAALQSSVKEFVTNERGNDDDRRMMVADLLSDDRAPFMPDDEFALREMSTDTLKKLRDAYLKANASEGDEGATSEGEHPVANGKDAGTSGAEVAAIVQNAVADGLKGLGDQITNAASAAAKAAVDEALKNHPAIIAANQAAEAKRAALIERVVSNSSISKEVAETMNDAALEAVANSVVHTASFAGRALPVVANKTEDIVKAMEPSSVVDFIRNRSKKEAA